MLYWDKEHIERIRNNDKIITHVSHAKHYSTITDEKMAEFVDVLKDNTHITNICLYSNMISSNSIRLLLRALLLNTTLQVLNLQLFKMEYTDYYYVAQYLANNNSLRELYLGDLKISGIEIGSICKALEYNKSLTTLVIPHGRYPHDSYLAVANMIRNNSTLLHLDLSFNGQYNDNTGINMVISALANNNTLQTIDLHCTYIEDEECVILAEILKTNKSLANINLAHNDIDKNGALALIAALKKNNTIKHLSLESNCRIPHELRLIISDMLCE